MTQQIATTPIAGTIFAVKIAPGPLLDAAGEKSASIVDMERAEITLDASVPQNSVAALVAAAVSTVWMETIREYAAALELAWERWQRDTDGIDDELHEDEAGGIFAGFDRLVRLGVKFDPTFIEKFEALHPVPSTFNPNDPQKGIRNEEIHAQSSESYIEDDDYEYRHGARIDGLHTYFSGGEGDADPDEDRG